MAKDFNREFIALLELVKETGDAQRTELAAALKGGKQPKPEEYWRVEPGELAEWKPGVVVHIYPESVTPFRTRFPKNGCSADTIRLLEGSLERYGFDKKQALKDRQYRQQRAKEAAAEAAAEAERRRHEAARLAQAQAPAPVRKMRKKWPKLEIVEADVDPMQALEMLEEKGDGSLIARPLSEANVRRFVRIHELGLWNPDFMAVDWYGFLINGRHRAESIIRADVTAPCIIVYGCNPKMYTSFDTAKSRTGGDTLVVEGLAIPSEGVNQNRMSSALKMLAEYKSSRTTGSFGRVRVENYETIQLAQRYPGIYEAMERGKVLINGPRDGFVRYLPSPAIVFCYLAVEAWPECGDILDHYLIGVSYGTGEKIGKNDPRKKLYDSMNSAVKRKRKINPIEQLALLLKMWNSFVLGRPAPQTLGWREDEPMPLAVTRAELEDNLNGVQL